MSEFILQIEKLLSAIGDAEYRYLLLEPLIFYGLFIGVIMLGIGFFLKAQRLQTAALIVVGVAAMAHFPYKDARIAAQPRMEQVYKLTTPSRVKGFAENTSAWVATSWQFKLLVLCVIATLMIGVHRNKIGFGLAIATMLLGLIAAKNAMWLNYQDAIAYHPNLKVHEAPIDTRTPAPASVPVVGKSDERRPEPAVSKPIAPASRASAATPPSRTTDRIPAPRPPSSPQARRVQPLPRY
ncbi:MAG: hypothetical protein ABL994_03590 [Verrucomicrobiales bacterium]